MKKLGYVFIGFAACFVLFVGCNAGLFGTVGTSIADTIIDATEIGFDSEDSDLDATTVKGAIDELAEDITSFKNQFDFSINDLVGNWYWLVLAGDSEPLAVTITADGSFTGEGFDSEIRVVDNTLLMDYPTGDPEVSVDIYFTLHRSGDEVWAEAQLYPLGVILSESYYNSLAGGGALNMSLPIPK